MEPKERNEFMRKAEQFLKAELKGKPFLLSLVVLEKMAAKEGENNQTHSFVLSNPPLPNIPYMTGRILMEVLGTSTIDFIQGMSINLQRVVRGIPKEEIKKEFG